jgi:hypothetical protein
MRAFFHKENNMKRMRILAAALALCLLGGCAPSGAASSANASAVKTVDSGTIAYAPLDDRPDNVERVSYLAESLGYTLTMPDADLYQTRLDGQPRNENGTQSGDRAALYEWVLAQEESGCDRYILSLDQLLSGGLVSSRAMQGDNPVTLSDGSVLTESEMLKNLLTTLAADQNNVVWLLDTVMRLAPTYGYGGFTLNEYNVLRAYGMEARPALSGDELTVEGIVADYSLSPDGNLIAAKSDEPLPDGAVKNYLASRERKLRLCDEAERLLAQDGFENVHLLIGIDDSSAEDSIQKNEIALLRRGLRDSDALLSGVDDLAFKAVTKLYLEESGWRGATARVLYFGGTEDSPACDYDYQPLTDIVEEHLNFFGLTEHSGTGAVDFEILVLTQPKTDGEKAAYGQALVEQINGNEAEGVPTILIDASNNAYGTEVHDALTKQCNLGALLSYSGFLDMAIVTGTALSYGVARYAWLQSGNGGDAAANAAFLRGLSESVVLDFCYRNTVRDELSAYVRNDLSGDPNNFYAPEIDLDAVSQMLSDKMWDSTKKVLDNFAHSNLIVSLAASGNNEAYETVGCGEIAMSDWTFPWNRVFEVRMDITVGALTESHKKVLWFYT